MTKNTEESDGRITIRFDPEELERAKECAEKRGFRGRKFSEWVRQIVREAVARDTPGYVPETSPANRPLTIVDQIKNSEEAGDLIYQIVADKLRLGDFRAELAAFSRRAAASSIRELDADLRLTAARIASVPARTVDDNAYVANGEVEMTIRWKETKWTLQEFQKLSAPERSACPFYLFTLAGNGRETAYYFWHAHNDFEKNFLETFMKNGFDPENDTAYVYGATYEVAAWCRSYQPAYLETRVVQMMRYVARDNDIGLYKELDDEDRRFFTVRNTGSVPPGIPCEFSFGWTSDDRNSGDAYYATLEEAVEAGKDWKTDYSFRPLAECRWHYTDEERREKKIEKTAVFDEEAVPKLMDRYLAY